MIKPTVLLYQFPKEKEKKLKILCLKMKVKIRMVKPSEYKEKIGFLVGDKRFVTTGELYEGEAFQEEMLLMAGLPNAEIDKFLTGLHKDKIAPVALKAVLTDTNSQMDSVTLHFHLKQESMGKQ